MKSFIIKKGTALTLTATILVGALAIPSYGTYKR